MINIRKATIEDVPVIHRLLTDMVTESGEEPGSTPDTLRSHGFGPISRFHVLLAERDAPLGLIIYFAEYSTWRGEMGLFVQDIFLKPQARGLGLGRRLLAEAMEFADWAPQFLTLMVAHKNTAARAFYASLGMELRDEADQLILQGQGLAALIAR